MRHHRHDPTQHRTDYRTRRPAPPATLTAALAAAPLVGMYLLTHPAVAATAAVAAGLTVGTLARRG